MKYVLVASLLLSQIALAEKPAHPFIGKWEYDGLRTADLVLQNNPANNPLANKIHHDILKSHRHVFEFTATQFRSTTDDRDIDGAVEMEKLPGGSYEIRLQAVCAPGWDIGTIKPTGTGFVVTWSARHRLQDPLIYTRVLAPPTTVAGDPGSPPIPSPDKMRDQKRNANLKLLEARKQLDEIQAINRETAIITEEIEAEIDELQILRKREEVAKAALEKLRARVVEVQGELACEPAIADIARGVENLHKKLRELQKENARLKNELKEAKLHQVPK